MYEAMPHEEYRILGCENNFEAAPVLVCTLKSLRSHLFKSIIVLTLMASPIARGATSSEPIAEQQSLALPLISNQADPLPESSPANPHPIKRWAQAAAAADSISTHIALTASNHLAEANPLANTSPAGLFALFGIKLLILETVERHYPELMPTVFRNTSAIWGGVSISNLALAAGAANPLALVVGVASGAYIYARGNEVIQADAVRVAPSEPQP